MTEPPSTDLDARPPRETAPGPRPLPGAPFQSAAFRTEALRGEALRDAAARRAKVRRRPVPAAAAWGGDPYARALASGRGPLYLRRTDGWVLPLEVERWCAPPDAADVTLLRRCRGSVLDIGCGPGRLVAGAAASGLPALGVDVSPAAVERTKSLGGAVLRRSVFDRLPAEGRWVTALLADGNIGIGGDPVALLRRVLQILAPGGRLLAEAAAYEVDERLTVRVEDAQGRQGRDFPWARLGPAALRAAARTAGWTVTEEWTARGRRFAALTGRADADARPYEVPAARANGNAL